MKMFIPIGGYFFALAAIWIAVFLFTGPGPLSRSRSRSSDD